MTDNKSSTCTSCGTGNASSVDPKSLTAGSSPKVAKQSLNLMLTTPKVVPPLDPEFRPAVLGNRRYRKEVQASGQGQKVVIGIERENGLVCRREFTVFPEGSQHDADTLYFVDRLVKFDLWSRGGWKIHYSGPEFVGRYLQASYAAGGSREFDVNLMSQVYEKPFEVTFVDEKDVPRNKENPSALGGHLDGNRIGFDLGASDLKFSAVVNGEVVFSTEVPWDPRNQADPDYHYRVINQGLTSAASYLPGKKPQAIGGSSAGVLVANRVMVASLFRAVPPELFDAKVKGMFIRLGKEWGVPLDVINDGDVTALAGGMAYDTKALLGVAMGSSQAAGYMDAQGRIAGWLNELAFAPVDYNPEAPADEWSGDRGVGVLYFSQQAVNKLAPKAGLVFPDSMGLPQRLEEVQRLMASGDQRVIPIYETIGIYLGYAIAHYSDAYDLQNVLILGRVTTGPGGDIIVEKAKEVLAAEFPNLASEVSILVPDEKAKRVGQAIAAASLPAIR